MACVRLQSTMWHFWKDIRGSSWDESLLIRLKGCNVILYTHPKTVSMYEKMGFRRQKTGMAIYNGNAESLKWMEDIGFLLEEGYRFGDNDYERQPYVSPRSIRQEQEKQNQTA